MRLLLAVLLITSCSSLRLKELTRCPSRAMLSETGGTTMTFPEGCRDRECDYIVRIQRDEQDNNLLLFKMEGDAEGWVAVGFSPTPNMESSDVVGCRRSSRGHIAIIDTWNSNVAKNNVLNEPQDDLCYYSAEYNNGRLKCIFSRAIIGSSPDHDFDLDNYFFLLFGTGDKPATDPLTEGFSYHGKTPLISRQLINPVTGRSWSPLIQTFLSSISTSRSWNAQVESIHCPPFNKSSAYRMSLRSPEGCVRPLCDFFLGINDNKHDSNVLDFTLEGKANGWVAVGFSKTQNMFTSDVLGCNVYSDGHLAAVDTWNPSSSKTNVMDSGQSDICQRSVEMKNGKISCTFSRSLKGTSKGQDLDLNSKYYLLYGTGDTPQGMTNGGFTFHENTPTVTTIQMNPAIDSDLSNELAMINAATACPDHSQRKPSEHRLSIGLPQGCADLKSASRCDFFLGVDTNSKDSSFLDFTLEGRAQGWVAVGFSKTPNMFTADVVGCNLYGDGSLSAVDTWNPSTSKTNILDHIQNGICQHSVRNEDGRLSCKFSRKISGTSSNQDLHLNDKYYVIIGTGNTPQASKTGGFTYHEKTPKISSNQVNPSEDKQVTVKMAMVENAQKEYKQHRLTRAFPEGCKNSNKKCDYFLGIDTNIENSSLLNFTLEAKTKGWVAVGFSKTPDMFTSDVLGCSVYSDGSVGAIDTWCPSSRKTNVRDNDQADIQQHTAEVKDGYLICKFSRNIKGTSKDQDLDLNSDYYILFGTGDSKQASKNSGGFTFHQKTPTISKTQINPVKDSDLILELAAVQDTETCSTSPKNYRISVGFPTSCGLPHKDCDYFLGINTNSGDSSLLDFTLQAKTRGWVAVGFSKTPSMPTSDVMGCNAYGDGSVEAVDTWCPTSRRINILDNDQADITQHAAENKDGYLCCKFSRSFKGTSKKQDLNLNSTYYLLYGKGTTRQRKNGGGGFTYHQKIPTISSTLVNPFIDSYSTLKQSVFDEGTKVSSVSSNTPKYRISKAIPRGCEHSKSKCNYFLGINTNSKDSSLLDFTLEAKANGWAAVGFSKTPSMLTSDVLGCNVYSDDSVAAIDTWCPSLRKTNVLDKDQADMQQHIAETKDGYLHCKFSRKIEGTTIGQDLDLDDNYYLLFGFGNTKQEWKNSGGFTFHQMTPSISDKMVNPAKDSGLNMEISTANKYTAACSTPLAQYRVQVGLPKGCDQSSNECNYFLGISTNTENSSLLDFTLQAKTNGWAAVGFSKTPSMLTSDVMGCNGYGDGSIAAIDTWCPTSRKINVLDNDQDDIILHTAGTKDGYLCCKFSRSLKGTSKNQDLDLDSKYYLLFGMGNTRQNSKSGRGFTFHQKTPKISDTQVNPAKDTYSTVKQTVTQILQQATGHGMSEKNKKSCPKFVSTDSKYTITKGIPDGCEQSVTECSFFLGINTNSENSSYLDFTLEGKAKGWVAVGFSKTRSMANSDVVGCNMYESGGVAAIDTWNPGYTNKLDEPQTDMCPNTAKYENGKIICKFSRLIKGATPTRDVDLQNGAYYVMYGTGQTPQGTSGGFSYHQTTPILSSVTMKVVEDTTALSNETTQATQSADETIVVIQALKKVLAQKTGACPTFSSTSSQYKLSKAFPEGCEHSKCTYFLGISTNSENSSYLDFTLEGKATGWVAVGFSKTPSMPNSDVVGCNRYTNGTVRAIDTWNPGYENVLDKPQTDMCPVVAKYENGRIMCKFSRFIKGATPGKDLDLNGNYYLMFGMGQTQQASSGGFTYHQTTPILTKQPLNVVHNDTILVSQRVLTSDATEALTKSHGILMIFAWPIFAGLAIYFPAFMKPVLNRKGEWFQLHRAFMLTSLALGLISFILIFVAHADRVIPGLANLQDPLTLAHFILGIIVTALPIINAILSLIRCKPTDKYRWIYNIIHGKMIGYIALNMALTNIAVGIYLFMSGPSQAFSIFLIGTIIGILMYVTLHIFQNVLPWIFQEQKAVDKDVLIKTENNTAINCKNMKNETYRSNVSILILVQLALVSIYIAVCVLIAVA